MVLSDMHWTEAKGADHLTFLTGGGGGLWKVPRKKFLQHSKPKARKTIHAQ